MNEIAAAESRYVRVLVALFAAFWVALAIAPWDRRDWAIENVAVVAFVVLLVWASRRGLVFGTCAVTVLFVFACLHLVGAHYTYAKVPYDAWILALTGRSLDAALGFERNQFDRLEHLLYGILLSIPLWEALVQRFAMTQLESRVLTVTVILATSALYELAEWGATALVAPDVGAAYLGLQGDEWDAQKDMALAALGAVVTMSLGALGARRAAAAAS